MIFDFEHNHLAEHFARDGRAIFQYLVERLRGRLHGVLTTAIAVAFEIFVALVDDVVLRRFRDAFGRAGLPIDGEVIAGLDVLLPPEVDEDEIPNPPPKQPFAIEEVIES
jgi:hypothetical protein